MQSRPSPAHAVRRRTLAHAIRQRPLQSLPPLVPEPVVDHDIEKRRPVAASRFGDGASAPTRAYGRFRCRRSRRRRRRRYRRVHRPSYRGTHVRCGRGSHRPECGGRTPPACSRHRRSRHGRGAGLGPVSPRSQCRDTGRNRNVSVRAVLTGTRFDGEPPVRREMVRRAHAQDRPDGLAPGVGVGGRLPEFATGPGIDGLRHGAIPLPVADPPTHHLPPLSMPRNGSRHLDPRHATTSRPCSPHTRSPAQIGWLFFLYVLRPTHSCLQ